MASTNRPHYDRREVGRIPMLEDFSVSLIAADALEIAAVRRELQYWLSRGPLAAEQVGDAVLACYEAMTNIVQHAYTSSQQRSLELHASHHRLLGRIAVTITDHGTWRSRAPDADTRGRGLPLLSALSDRADILTHRDGTTVHMSWDLPASAAPRYLRAV